jgi:hypothetical protein
LHRPSWRKVNGSLDRCRNIEVFDSEPKAWFYQEAETDRNTFAVISLWGKFGGLCACAATFPHIVPLPNIFLTGLFSKTRLKRKDFQEIVRLTWAQEAPGSNPGAPTKTSCVLWALHSPALQGARAGTRGAFRFHNRRQTWRQRTCRCRSSPLHADEVCRTRREGKLVSSALSFCAARVHDRHMAKRGGARVAVSGENRCTAVSRIRRRPDETVTGRKRPEKYSPCRARSKARLRHQVRHARDPVVWRSERTNGTGRITSPRPNRDELMEIRKAKYSLREIQELAQQLESEALAAQATSPLPGKVDREAVSRLLTDVQLHHWNAAPVQPFLRIYRPGIRSRLFVFRRQLLRSSRARTLSAKRKERGCRESHCLF